MQGIQQMIASTPQVADSAASVANALSKPRATSHAASTAKTASSTLPPAVDKSMVTANDFLTLLVAEMKNQDPTQPTDPNAYISQMVGVNSLQQLIGINQGVTSLDTATGVATKSSAA